MEDKNIQDPVSTSLHLKGSGSMLAEARKKQNKTVEEIASELNLTVQQIRTIELDQTDGLPEPTYVRGYIRSYANLLGLDVEIKPIRLVFFLLICGGAAYLWFSGIFHEQYDLFFGVDSSQTELGLPNRDLSNDLQSNGADNSLVNLAEQTNDLNVENSISDDVVEVSDGVITGSLLPVEEEGIENESGPVVPSNNDNSNAQDQVASSTEDNLVFNFTQKSWIDIRDQDNVRLANNNYTPGEVLSVSSDGPMSVFIGNAEGVTVQLNGENFDIEQYREGVYAKFIVNEN